jgi:hypothetical protein
MTIVLGNNILDVLLVAIRRQERTRGGAMAANMHDRTTTAMGATEMQPITILLLLDDSDNFRR